MAFTWSVDTFWTYFAGRMSTINSQRRLMGIMDAQDWPPKDVVDSAFYLITVGENPMGKSFGSATIPAYEFTLQFTWIIGGTDTSTLNQVEGRYRGDRYRTNFQMKQELIQALYPQYTLKESFPVGAIVGGAFTPQTIVPEDPMWWAPPAFMTRADRDSGRLYTTATVRMVSMTDEILV